MVSSIFTSLIFNWEQNRLNETALIYEVGIAPTISLAILFQQCKA